MSALHAGAGAGVRRVRAYAPGSIGNLGPGLDALGLATDGAGDCVEAELVASPGIVVLEAGHPALSADPARHTAALAAREVLRQTGLLETTGLSLRVTKGLPLAGGQGGSAASAVAGAVAVNALLGRQLDTAALLACCLVAEKTVAGRHLDNIAPSLLGGAVLVRSMDPIDAIVLPVPAALHVVLAHPDQRLPTVEGRSVLPATVSRGDAVHQLAQVGAIVAALASGDLALLGRAIDDRIAEPARAPLLPGFAEAKRAALAAGALGCSISGSGPTAFALLDGPDLGPAVADAMQRAYRDIGIEAGVRVAAVDRCGARII